MNLLYLNSSMTQMRLATSTRYPTAPELDEPSFSTGLANSLDAAASPKKAKKHLPAVVIKRSGIHGKGVYANRAFKRNELIIEYKGEIITWEEAILRHPHDPSDPNHTFYFHLDDGHVIDGKYKGNAAKWINHACTPNCEAYQEGQRVFIRALKAIKSGQELFYNYGLVVDQRITAKLKKEFACWCGSPDCRGTMLSSQR